MSRHWKRAICLETEHLFFIDNLKVFLVLLVLAWHASLPYSGCNWWFFESQQYHSFLRPFLFVNEGFLMGLFFFISGYFLPSSFDRKGAVPFVKERLLRLGLPLFVVFVAVIPVLMYAYYLNFRNHGTLSFCKYLFNVYFIAGPKPANWTGPAWPDMHFGHMWFVQHLLLYAGVYALLRIFWARLKGHSASSYPVSIKQPIPPRHAHYLILGLTLFTAVATFFIRIWYPRYTWIPFLGFIQVEFAHFPHYVFLFCLGVVAFRRNWLWRLPKKVRLHWLWIGAAGVFLYFSTLIPAGESFSFAVLESFTCFGVCIGLVTLFQEHFQGRGRLIRLLAVNTYGVYIIHVPVIVALQYYIEDFNLHPLLTVTFIVAIGAVVSFLLSHLLFGRTDHSKGVVSSRLCSMEPVKKNDVWRR